MAEDLNNDDNNNNNNNNNNNDNKVFSAGFLWVKPVFVLVYIFNQQITAFENIPPQRREVVISGNGIAFTEALLFGGIKYILRNIYLILFMAVQIHIKVFELPLFS